MKTVLMVGLAALLCAGCSRGDGASAGMRKTNFPGMVTAGGGTSGEVMARNKKPQTEGSTTGGTPFHAGGAEGNTGGAATAGAVQETGHGPSGSSTPPVAKPTPNRQ